MNDYGTAFSFEFLRVKFIFSRLFFFFFLMISDVQICATAFYDGHEKELYGISERIAVRYHDRGSCLFSFVGVCGER